jgi:predicted kinase
MRDEPVKLYFLCGKMAAGKSTFAKELARAKNAVLLVQDELLGGLYPAEIQTIQDFAKYAARLREALSLHVRDILSHGVPVVLDFPGNTRTQRQWFRALVEAANVEHELHFIDATDEVCKRQLRQRSQALPAGSAWTTNAEFDAITAYFEAPTEDENFNVVRHEPVCPEDSARVTAGQP